MTIDTTIPDYLRRDKDNRMPDVAPMTKPFVYSYTNLHCYDDVCPYQFFRTYIKKDIPYVATVEMDFGKKVHTAMEQRIGGGKPLPAEMRQWEKFAAPFDVWKPRVEVKLGITRDGKPTGFFDKDVAGRGMADVVVMQNTSAMIFDHKTGKSKYEHPFELEIHAMFLKAANPQLTKVSGSFIWLKEDRMGSPHDLSDFNSTWARVNNTVERIEDDMASGEWEKKRNPLCGWCRVFDCEHNGNQNR